MSESKKFGGEPTTPPPDPDLPYIWFDGQWLLMVQDTTDGVPESLELPDRGRQGA